MSIHIIHHSHDSYQAAIVSTAMVRSFSAAQVIRTTYSNFDAVSSGAVLINPTDDDLPLLRQLLSGRAKVLVLGNLGRDIAAELQLHLDPAAKFQDCQGSVRIDQSEPFNSSPLAVSYCDSHPLSKAATFSIRHLCRYDFSDEWNNLGYGRITTDAGPWSLACIAEVAGAIPIAQIEDIHANTLSAYITLLDLPCGSVLWCNRQIGPVDSLEWHVVEYFFADYRPDELPCFAYLSEIPAGYDGAVTARLDCDQAIASARSLYELYASRELPISLALLTGLSANGDDFELLREIIANGGAVLAHSSSHLPNWGGSHRIALQEAHSCKNWLDDNLPSSGPSKFAVSPAHQNPPYALRALADAGFSGFAGGIIHNDPEFLIGRAGQVPFIENDFISHSQQCMLHGQCYHRAGNSLDVYKQSFDNHIKAKAIFGYLDHPFSSVYQYDWASEQERLRAHEALIDHMQSLPNIWWPNLNECLDFLVKRNATRIHLSPKGKIVIESAISDPTLPAVEIMHRGESIVCS